MSKKYSSLDDWKEDFKSKEYYREWSEFILHDVLTFSTKGINRDTYLPRNSR